MDLDWAVGVWQSLRTNPGIEEIRTALSICRYWHADRIDLLRRADKNGKDWLDIKHEEEVLEVYITDLKDALWTTAHMNKMVGSG